MEKKGNSAIGGLFLLGLGLFFLLDRFFNLPDLGNLAVYFLAALGVAFLFAGVLRREAGLMIPGGILTGLGLGVVLASGQFVFLGGDQQGAVFMAAFAFGWLLITLFTAVFTDETHWWPLIPGGIMALISASLLFEGQFGNLFSLFAFVGPLLLIGLGLIVLFKAFRSSPAEQATPDIDELKELEKKTG